LEVELQFVEVTSALKNASNVFLRNVGTHPQGSVRTLEIAKLKQNKLAEAVKILICFRQVTVFSFG
jgi:hypothetical protein